MPHSADPRCTAPLLLLFLLFFAVSRRPLPLLQSFHPPVLSILLIPLSSVAYLSSAAVRLILAKQTPRLLHSMVAGPARLSPLKAPHKLFGFVCGYDSVDVLCRSNRNVQFTPNGTISRFHIIHECNISTGSVCTPSGRQSVSARLPISTTIHQSDSQHHFSRLSSLYLSISHSLTLSLLSSLFISSHSLNPLYHLSFILFSVSLLSPRSLFSRLPLLS